MLTESACSSDISLCPISDGQTNRYHPYCTLFRAILATLSINNWLGGAFQNSIFIHDENLQYGWRTWLSQAHTIWQIQCQLIEESFFNNKTMQQHNKYHLSTKTDPQTLSHFHTATVTHMWFKPWQPKIPADNHKPTWEVEETPWETW